MVEEPLRNQGDNSPFIINGVNNHQWKNGPFVEDQNRFTMILIIGIWSIVFSLGHFGYLICHSTMDTSRVRGSQSSPRQGAASPYPFFHRPAPLLVLLMSGAGSLLTLCHGGAESISNFFPTGMVLHRGGSLLLFSPLASLVLFP